jgi:hypothetical protein
MGLLVVINIHLKAIYDQGELDGESAAMTRKNSTDRGLPLEGGARDGRA